MRFALHSRTLLLLAMPAVLVTCAAAQDHPNVQPSKISDQLNKPPAASQPAPAPMAAKPPAQQPKAPEKAPAKAPATPQGKASAKPNPAAKTATAPAAAPAPAPVKGPAATAEKKPAKPPVEKPAEEKISGVRRDPFDPLLNKPNQGTGTPQHRVYFLREGDKLYDGSVQHITLEAVSFQEVGKDAFGKPLERQVTKRLYPSPGEQQ